MDAVNVFARMPDSPESIIAQVRRDLTTQATVKVDIGGDDLDRIAETAVRELWESRVKTFVPVLALRQARAVLRDREPIAVMPLPVAPAAAVIAKRAHRDLLSIASDVLRVEDDVIVLDD